MAESVHNKFELEMRLFWDLILLPLLMNLKMPFNHKMERQENAISNYWDSIEAALELVKQGRANAIGEVGRPHWKVSDEVWDLSNQLLKKTMKIANENNVSLQLHVEGKAMRHTLNWLFLQTRLAWIDLN